MRTVVIVAVAWFLIMQNALVTSAEIMDIVTDKVPTKRIVGGVEAVQFEFPWLAGLISESKDSDYSGQFCGGSLIASNWVLTAAHCVCPIKVSLTIRIILKRHRLSKPTEGGESHEVDRVICHPSYNDDTLDYDVALLRLKTHSSVTPISMVTNTTTLENSDTMLTVAGWGKLNYNQYADTMHKVDVPIISRDVCSRLYTNPYGRTYITSRMICAGYLEGKKDACQGDSGGPLFHKSSSNQLTLVGTVSWGDGCAERNKPGVYGRISDMRSWITSSMSSCCSANKFIDFSGTIKAVGETIRLPQEGHILVTKSGTVAFGLKGPKGKDYDLIIQQWRSSTSTWVNAAWSELSSISVEQTSKSFVAGDKLSILVRADSGTGAFQAQAVGIGSAEISLAGQSTNTASQRPQSRSPSQAQSRAPSSFTRIVFQTDYSSFTKNNSANLVVSQLSSILGIAPSCIRVLVVKPVTNALVAFDFAVSNTSSVLTTENLHTTLSSIFKSSSSDLGFPINQIEDSNGAVYFNTQASTEESASREAQQSIQNSRINGMTSDLAIFALFVGCIFVLVSAAVVTRVIIRSRAQQSDFPVQSTA